MHKRTEKYCLIGEAEVKEIAEDFLRDQLRHYSLTPQSKELVTKSIENLNIPLFMKEYGPFKTKSEISLCLQLELVDIIEYEDGILALEEIHPEWLLW